MPRLRLAIVLFIGLAGSCADLIASSPAWTQVRSPHFRVLTDAGGKQGVEVAEKCEQMRSAFLILMAKATGEDPAPLTIVALKSRQEVDDIAQGYNRKLHHAGMFLPGSEQSFILADISEGNWHTLYHEYAHELLQANAPAAVQTWFEEGFAEYFSTLEVNSRETRIGQVPAGELNFLRQNGKLIRLADLVRVNQDSRLYNQSGPEQAVFYAQSWLLVHYLFDHQLINRAQAFFTDMARGASLDESVAGIFGIKVSELERELLAYARGESFRYFALPAPAASARADMVLGTVDATTVAALKLEIRWQGRQDHSQEELVTNENACRSLLTRDPENAAVLRGLARTLMDENRYLESYAALRHARNAEPDNALNHHAMAELLRLMDSSGMASEHPDDTAEQEARATIAVDPSFADAYRIMAATLADRGDLGSAVAALLQAVRLSPRIEGYQLELANLELMKRDFGPAMALLRQLQNSQDARIAKQAEFSLSSSVAEKDSSLP